MTDARMHLLVLDWRRAFDSLDHTAIMDALARFGSNGTISPSLPSWCRRMPSLPTQSTPMRHCARRLSTIDVAFQRMVSGPTYNLEYADDALLSSRKQRNTACHATKPRRSCCPHQTTPPEGSELPRLVNAFSGGFPT